MPVTLAVTVTIAAALAFQPVRRRLESAVSRRLFGDRVRQYQLLKNLGTTMEQTAELDELLPRLAHAVRDGIGTSWVQVRLRDADGSWLEDPVGVAGEVTGDSAAGVDLVRAGELVGRVDLGPRPGGYAPDDLELLATVAAQASTAVANVRLASQLKEGLEQLSTSRVRLIAAQDAERRRIERDLHDGIQQEVVASSPVFGSPATDSVVTSSPPPNSPICKIKPVRCFGTSGNSPAASTRLCSATMGSSQRWSSG